MTCAICGELADERETINLYDQENTQLEGESHHDCWDNRGCLDDSLFAPAPDADSEAAIDPRAETVSLPVVCKVCGESLRARYSLATVSDPDENTVHSLPSVQLKTHTQTLHGIVQELVNSHQIDPEKAHYLRDDIRALRDRLEHWISAE